MLSSWCPWGGTVRRVFVTMVAVVGLTASGCGAQTKSPADSATITLYNGQHPETTDALVAAFEKDTEIHVKVREGDEDVLANQIVEEGKSSPADVFYTENSQALQFLQGRGLLAAVRTGTLANVDARYNSPAGHWVGVSARVSVMVYNTKMLSANELPTSVLQLASSRWAGKLGLAPSETDFQPIITAVAHTYGQPQALRWLDGLKKTPGAIPTLTTRPWWPP